MSNIKATFSCNLQSVWQVVTSLTDYSWRSDVEKIEVISDTQFVEITKSGYKTTFTVTRQEPFCLWEFDMENDNMKGHWIGVFSGNEKNATIEMVYDSICEDLFEISASQVCQRFKKRVEKSTAIDFWKPL